MKKLLIGLCFVFSIGLAQANIMCNDGTESPTCETCHQGCCSHHGGCAAIFSEDQGIVHGAAINDSKFKHNILDGSEIFMQNVYPLLAPVRGEGAATCSSDPRSVNLINVFVNLPIEIGIVTEKIVCWNFDLRKENDFLLLANQMIGDYHYYLTDGWRVAFFQQIVESKKSFAVYMCDMSDTRCVIFLGHFTRFNANIGDEIWGDIAK